ncbi:hypothetical protein KSF73_08460 [Burkholderiaceae bacterium DAT-1]|nr:hypothetical protein [Burkholderiaceae bacterium DAT-1]
MRFLLLAMMTYVSVHADVVVIANPKQAGLKLNADQVANAFIGKKVSLPDGTALIPLNQAEGKASRSAFLQKVTGKDDAQLKAYWSKMVFTGKGDPPKEVGGDADVKKIVSSNPNTIGYVDKSVVDASVIVVYSE